MRINIKIVLTSIVLILLSMADCNAQQNKKELIIETILKNDKVNEFFHLQLNNRKAIYILKNKYINEDLKLSNINYRYVDKQDSSNTPKRVLDFSPLEISENTATFTLFDSFENISIEGTLKKENSKWTINSFNVFQF